eukprot:1379832-Amphidinium_carterae.1
MTMFRMVAHQLRAELGLHPLRAEPRREQQQKQVRDLPQKSQHQTERVQHTCQPVNSAFVVEPTFLDPTNVSTTSVSTPTRCSDDISMLTIPKQQSHKRGLPSIFECNKQDQSQGHTTTYKNWVSELLQIYMSLADHNISTLMDEFNQHKIPIVDDEHIEYELKKQGLSQKDADDRRAKELQRLLQQYDTQNADILQMNEERRERREVDPCGAIYGCQT